MDYLKRISDTLQSLASPHPVRDWYILFTIASTAALILAGIAVYFFIGIQLGFIIGSNVTDETNIPTVSREKLSRVLEIYEERKLNFDADNYPVPNVSDPTQ